MKRTHTHTHTRLQRNLQWGCAIAGLIALSSSAVAERPDYRLIDLGEIEFSIDFGKPTADYDLIALNNEGQVVYGGPDANDDMQAWVWLQEPAFGLSAQTRHLLKDIFTNHPATSFAYDINDNGLIVGAKNSQTSASIGLSGREAMLWNLDPNNREFHALGLLQSGSNHYSYALAISNETDPTITGVATILSHCSGCDNPPVPTDDVMPRGFQLDVESGDPDLPMSALAPSGDNNRCTARSHGVNAGTVVGFENDGGGQGQNPCLSALGGCSTDLNFRGRKWAAGAGSALASLSGDDYGAFAINENGAVAGWGETSTDEFCSRVGTLAASPTATPVALPSLTEENHVALGLSDATDPQVVGYSETQNVALLWTKTGGSYERIELNDVAEDCGNDWNLRQAHDVNDDGWIVGYGTKNGVDHAFLLIPITETCSGDATLDGTVDVFDLLYVLAQFGGSAPCLADVDFDDDIDVFDLLEVLDEWGACAGGAGPESLEQELMHAGLPADADDDYLYVLQNGTQAEIDNYNCWVDHYLLACGPLCQHNCPDDDPWGRH